MQTSTKQVISPHAVTSTQSRKARLYNRVGDFMKDKVRPESRTSPKCSCGAVAGPWSISNISLLPNCIIHNFLGYFANIQTLTEPSPLAEGMQLPMQLNGTAIDSDFQRE